MNQVLKALDYIHHVLHISHGAIFASNILLNRTGLVKVANVGRSVLNRSEEYSKDCRALADIFLSLHFPLDIKPDSDRLEDESQDFYSSLRGGEVGGALKVCTSN